MASRGGRPWGPLRGTTPQENQAAALLRGWLDEAGLTVGGLHGELRRGDVLRGPVPCRTTVAERLAGHRLTVEFIDAVAAVCFDAVDRTDRIKQARELLTSPVRPPETFAAIPPTAAGGSAPPPPSPEEVAQLRLNVVEMRRRMRTALEDNAALTAERDELRRRCAILARALSASQSTVRGLTERWEKRADSPEPSSEPGDEEPEPPGQGPGDSGGSGGPARGGPAPRAGSGHAREVHGERGAAPTLVADTTACGPGLPIQAVGLPPAFEAFFAMNVSRYAAYARLHLRKDMVDTAVLATFNAILHDWLLFLQQPQPAAWAWQILRRSVAEQARRVSPRQVLSQAMRDARASLGGMPSELGLYDAIAELPERQFDVIVLRFVLGYPTDRIAHLMGLGPATVRSHQRAARRTLAARLGVRAGEEEW
ncbi:sigma-70 family RNA polymerase sigma factor [Streptomyces sp. TLI_146]|uniref:sigma-70 family RNA polymerase sigma factor n=1 Tax=Streptomyces sp. TLI_146 TaxID=1938858 RepID=UPI000CA6A7BB|nr:sigma-70 family RNA polymerase sigma factor [Streptomyces sp. TLI_146]PKV83674.1 DNA-directed RNA polymerase specialized sigma24 family protein [Streptomyces sp. TLI_146]